MNRIVHLLLVGFTHTRNWLTNLTRLAATR